MKNKLKLIFLLPILLITSACGDANQKPKAIHSAHLSSGWYPQNKDKLETELKSYFEFTKSNLNAEVDPNSIKALIAPHAGIYFSGICAASTYQNLFNNKETQEKNTKIKRVIILAPSHSKPFEGIALPNYDAYKTALGTINVDMNAIEKLGKNGLFNKIEGAHDPEHSIEIQLPFLQTTIDSFQIIPLVVGFLENGEYDSISKTLKNIIDDSTLIVISSDFIHYGSNYRYQPFSKDLSYKIRFLDSLALESIMQQSFELFDRVLQETGASICGQNPIKILLKMLESNILTKIEARLSSYYTSAQITQARNRSNGEIKIKNLIEDVPDSQNEQSVSYFGIVFTTDKLANLKKENQLTDYEKQVLLKLARKTLENSFLPESKKLPEHLLFPVKSEGLKQESGAFVTLDKSGELRGCIGRIVAKQPLYKTVQEMSKAAAFQDHRFRPVTKDELKNIEIDISILTQPKLVKNYRDITIGKHGVVLKKQTRLGWLSSVFLPQVPPANRWDLQTTLEQLSLKAGLAKDEWKEDCEFEVFEGFEIKE